MFLNPISEILAMESLEKTLQLKKILGTITEEGVTSVILRLYIWNQAKSWESRKL